MDVLSYSGGDFRIKLQINNKLDNFTWSLVAVYGAAQDEFKLYFLRQFVNLTKDNLYPIILGDSNLLPFTHEKCTCRFNNRWYFLFNAIVDSLNLR
jgi:hypothetical protein